MTLSFLSLPEQDPPHGWKHLQYSGVGGCLAVACSPDSRYLLVASTQGRGVFDLRTGKRVARDDEDDGGSWLNPAENSARGIGPLAGMELELSGIWGGRLRAETEDGWTIRPRPLPEQYGAALLVERPGEDALESGAHVSRLREPLSAVLAFGFSPDGQALILATGADVTIYARD